MKPLVEAKLDRGWKDWIAYLDQRLRGVETGEEALDKYLLGLGGITVIQGSTGSCKSTWALQIAHHNLKKGHPCIMLDRENGINRLRNRLICQSAGVSENDLKASRGDIEALREYRDSVKSLPLYIYTETTSNTELIKERIAECLALYKKPMTLLIDSIQAMPPLDTDRAKSIELWMGFLDQLKLDFEGKLTIIVTSEINRASYGGENDAVGAGKGSNSIEYKAETLFDLRSSDDPDVLRLKVAKHRDGQKGAVFLLEKGLSNPENKASFNFRLHTIPEGGSDI